MALESSLREKCAEIFETQWAEREPRSVLDSSSVGLGGDAIKYDPATVLYTDIDESTKLAKNYPWYQTSEIFKAFLYCSTRLITHFGGTVTSYDGDRVMGIFVGKAQSRNAVRCALNINHVRRKVIQPAYDEQYPESKFKLRAVTGVDVGLTRGVRTGARGSNDLAWVGIPPNYAAKLTELSASYPTRITARVYNRLRQDEKKDGANSMWQAATWTTMSNLSIYRSTYSWNCSPLR